MTFEKSEAVSQPAPGGPPLTMGTQKVTIFVKTDGTFDPTAYSADDGDDCAVVPATGSTFTGTVVCTQGVKVLATWTVSTTAVYTVPTPNPPGSPYAACVLTSVPSGGGTNRTGSINIGTRPPFAPPHSSPAKQPE